MLRSMYSGISGMKVNQTKLDVIGNNIANVNTTSFKSSRATFSDLLSQSSSSAQAGSTTKGGINGKQVGLGVQLSSIDRIMTQGSMQSTSRNLDLGLDGNGYFMVSTGPVISGDGAIEVSQKAGSHAINETSLSASGASISYTRDGSFTLDNEGNLLTTDGYRVLGYSLTNDDNSQAATAKSPADGVKLGGLNFSFSAGTQLNGVTIQLGTIGSGTPTSASLSGTGNNKILTINGDFSTTSTLGADQIKKAINAELLAKGISQSVNVSGTIPKISDIESKAFEGGTDATAPGSVSVLGYNINFTETAAANKKTIRVGNLSTADPSGLTQVGGVKASVIGDDIFLYGNFMDGSITGDAIAEAINKAAIDAKISDTDIVENVTGKVSSDITGLKKSTPDFTLAKTVTAAGSVMGCQVVVDDYGAKLNNMLLKFEDSKGAKNINVSSANGIITISGDFDTMDINSINEAIKKRADEDGDILHFHLTGTFSKDSSDKSVQFNNDGINSSVPYINIAGLQINFPSTGDIAKSADAADIEKTLKGLKFKIGETSKKGDPTVRFDDASNSVIINGNFFSSGAVDVTALQNALNNELSGKIGGLNFTVGSSANQSLTNLKSDKITGGTDFKQASVESGLGLKFTPQGKTGATLNGYTIQVGTASPGTPLTAKVDTKSKVITINGDFVTAGAVTAEDVSDVLNKQLTNTFGSDVSVKVEESSQGSLLNLSGQTEANKKVEGGTSVQSIAEDGTINYVSASTDVYSYDGSLKTLKIPEKVRSADGIEVAVKSYSISSKGIITATLDDGTIAALGQIALASFSNPAGLVSDGGNLYSVSPNSGNATVMSGIGTTGDDNSAAYADMLSGYLEMSNVDLAEQFTDMITTTKAFQGAAKMITTGDDILTEIINLKR